MRNGPERKVIWALYLEKRALKSNLVLLVNYIAFKTICFLKKYVQTLVIPGKGTFTRPPTLGHQS